MGYLGSSVQEKGGPAKPYVGLLQGFVMELQDSQGHEDFVKEVMRLEKWWFSVIPTLLPI